jgi:penicillin G amidase
VPPTGIEGNVVRRLPVLLLTTLAAAATALSATASPTADPVADPVAHLRAETVLPPGNATHYGLAGQIAGMASGDPAAYGDHVDDQRGLYWGFEFKDGGFTDECAESRSFRTARLCVPDYGVPVVHADTLADAWYALGHAVVEQRLFLTDAVRRTARGTLSELTGPGGVPEDVATRVLTYTDAELEAMLAATSDLGREVAAAHVEGMNDAIAAMRQDPSSLPAEYVLLQAVPQEFTLLDIAAMGVLMTRTVASEGGTEMDNVAALRALEATLGTAAGRGAFEDLVWIEDAEATVTVPREEGVFPRTTQTPDERAAAFQTMADYAATLPLELADGIGTGAYPEPAAGLPGAPFELPVGFPAVPAELSDDAVRARVADALEAFRTGLHGGSFGVAIAPSRTADGSTLLMSEPQLGYAPTLLWEAELHAGDVHVRGSTVAGLPVIGIGYTPRTAWALTTGMSKTIESFIETIRDDDGTVEHLHGGEWKPLDCRIETVTYRQAVEGVPIGPALNSVDVEVCRSVHGPVVATSEDGTMARAVRYAMWQRELDNLDGILGWNLATNLAEFEAAMRQVTWNENTVYADADGHIAYWHPGLHRVRDPRTDLRLPQPGTGEYDGGGFLPFEALPQVVDPAQGFIANWNNKPAHGWLDGEGQAYSVYPAGKGGRVKNLTDALAARDDWTFAALRDLDRIAASRDPRAVELLPLLLALRDLPDLTDLERAALGVLAGWDRSANGPGAGMEHTDGETATVGAAWTVFDRIAKRLVSDLLAPLDVDGSRLFARQSRVSSGHPYDLPPALSLALRILDPTYSALAPSRDYLAGRTPAEVLRGVLSGALAELAEEQGNEDVASWRGPYHMASVCSASGAIGPCLEMPVLERGTWIHLVGFEATAPSTPAPTTPATTPGAPSSGAPLPTTGGGLAVGGLIAVGALITRRRRPPSR